MRDLPIRAHRRKRQDRRIREDNRADGVAQVIGAITLVLISICSRVVLLPRHCCRDGIHRGIGDGVGVPLITPDCGSSPVPQERGRHGVQRDGSPLLCGTFGMIATPCVYTTEVSR